MKILFTILVFFVCSTSSFAQDFGWHHDEAAIKEMSIRPYAATRAGRSTDPLPSEVFLWKMYEKVMGKGAPCKSQGKVGCCVAFGTANAISMTMAVQIALGADFEYRDLSEEVIYGGSRVQIGGGKIRGDGSIGAWAAKFVQQYGVMARDKYGNFDLTVYSEKTCREFGNKGVPAELIAIAKNNPVKDIARVSSWSQAKSALAQGYGISICSGVGFNGKRDANGVKKANGYWAHCMALWGYCTLAGKEYGFIENSHGEEEGPVGPGKPNKAGFYVDSNTVEIMLRAGDSWAFSTLVGFPARKLDWFVFAPRKEIPWYALLSQSFA